MKQRPSQTVSVVIPGLKDYVLPPVKNDFLRPYSPLPVIIDHLHCHRYFQFLYHNCHSLALTHIHNRILPECQVGFSSLFRLISIVSTESFFIAKRWRLKDSYLRLVGIVCSKCGAKLFPSRDICPECGKDTKIDSSPPRPDVPSENNELAQVAVASIVLVSKNGL